MSDCDSLHPLFRDITKGDDVVYHARRRARPSQVEALAVVVVLLLALVTNFDRWAGAADTEAAPVVIVSDDSGSEFDLGHCRDTSMFSNC